MAHWVCHSPLKELDYNNFSERKGIIEDLEDNLTGTQMDASNTDNLAVAEGANTNEAITAVHKYRNDMEMYLEEEYKIEAYQETMQIDIENIDKIENIHKHYTKQ